MIQIIFYVKYNVVFVLLATLLSEMRSDINCFIYFVIS